MFKTVAVLVVAFLASALAQNPKITSVRPIPGVPIPRGTCSAQTTSGYLELEGRTTFTDAELGKIVREGTAPGQVLTIYPATKRGIFIVADCPDSDDPAFEPLPKK